jgi:hypothetical protein
MATQITKGFSTYLGVGLAAVAAACAGAVVAFNGLPDDTPTALVVLALVGAAALSASRVIDGRMKQAEALIDAKARVDAQTVLFTTPPPKPTVIVAPPGATSADMDKIRAKVLEAIDKALED